LSEAEQNDWYNGSGSVAPYLCESSDSLDISVVVNNAGTPAELDEYGDYYSIYLNEGHVQLFMLTN
jgi:hypothetical protein